MNCTRFQEQTHTAKLKTIEYGDPKKLTWSFLWINAALKQAISKSALDKENSRQPQGTVTTLTENRKLQTNQITVKFVGKTEMALYNRKTENNRLSREAKLLQCCDLS